MDVFFIFPWEHVRLFMFSPFDDSVGSESQFTPQCCKEETIYGQIYFLNAASLHTGRELSHHSSKDGSGGGFQGLKWYHMSSLEKNFFLKYFITSWFRFLKILFFCKKEMPGYLLVLYYWEIDYFNYVLVIIAVNAFTVERMWNTGFPATLTIYLIPCRHASSGLLWQHLLPVSCYMSRINNFISKWLISLIWIKSQISFFCKAQE